MTSKGNCHHMGCVGSLSGPCCWGAYECCPCCICFCKACVYQSTLHKVGDMGTHLLLCCDVPYLFNWLSRGDHLIAAVLLFTYTGHRQLTTAVHWRFFVHQQSCSTAVYHRVLLCCCLHPQASAGCQQQSTSALLQQQARGTTHASINSTRSTSGRPQGCCS
jgi:hypothetical protein